MEVLGVFSLPFMFLNQEQLLYFKTDGKRIRASSHRLFRCRLDVFSSSSGTTLINFSSVQSLSRVRLFATPWTAACQASLSITNSRNLLTLKSIELVMPSNHLILCV